MVMGRVRTALQDSNRLTVAVRVSSRILGAVVLITAPQRLPCTAVEVLHPSSNKTTTRCPSMRAIACNRSSSRETHDEAISSNSNRTVRQISHEAAARARPLPPSTVATASLRLASSPTGRLEGPVGTSAASRASTSSSSSFSRKRPPLANKAASRRRLPPPTRCRAATRRVAAFCHRSSSLVAAQCRPSRAARRRRLRAA